MKKIRDLFSDFIESEKTGGLILISMTIISICMANSAFQVPYIEFWFSKIYGLELFHIINDGLMTVFFLLIGLELEREVYKGELSNFRKASLPIFAAVGGMVVPVLIYLIINPENNSSGAGIPMATDIAFSISILALLWKSRTHFLEDIFDSVSGYRRPWCYNSYRNILFG